jgi:hypothetical protein
MKRRNGIEETEGLRKMYVLIEKGTGKAVEIWKSKEAWDFRLYTASITDIHGVTRPSKYTWEELTRAEIAEKYPDLYNRKFNRSAIGLDRIGEA